MKNPTYYTPPLTRRRRSGRGASRPAWLSSALLPGAFMLGVIGVGGVLGLSALSQVRVSGNPNVLEGRWAAAFEKGFNDRQALRGSGLATWTAVEFYGFGTPRPGALLGQQGFLFTSEELAFYPDAKSNLERSFRQVQQVREALEQQGVRLVVALVPSKARVYTDKLEGGRLPEYARNTYAEFRARLAGANIAAPDLLGPLSTARARGQTFLHTDTHWTPFGAQVAASSLAEAVRAPNLPRASFATRKTGEERLKGDLFNYLPLGVFSGGAPAPDTLERFQTVRVGSAGLLDDLTPPVALVGTSYSASPKWNFEGALKSALGADVVNLSLEGRGPFEPMKRYLSSAELQDTPPKVVVWEMPERYLSMPEGALEDGK